VTPGPGRARTAAAWLLAAGLPLGLCLAGCAAGPPPGCARPSPVSAARSPHAAGTAGAEVRGTGHGARLWGLLMRPYRKPLIRAGDQVKIAWRMTGTGPLRLTATAPDGRPRPLVQGPERHATSSYHRPGDEWGARYRFDRAGCWHLHATRTRSTADVWLTVTA
jgi:hypothetical protein